MTTKYSVGDVLTHPNYANSRTVTGVGKHRYLWMPTDSCGADEYSASHSSLDRWTKKPRELAKDQKWINGGGTYTVVGVCDGYVIYVRATHPDSGLYVSTEEEFRDDFTWISDV